MPSHRPYRPMHYSIGSIIRSSSPCTDRFYFPYELCMTATSYHFFLLNPSPVYSSNHQYSSLEPKTPLPTDILHRLSAVIVLFLVT